MAKVILPDELWKIIEPLLPPDPPRRERYPGRRRLQSRNCLTGILFVLTTGIPWELLPQEMGYGSGMTCWRRLRDWNEAGVWEELHAVLLDRLQGAGLIDWSRAVVDSSSVRSVGAGEKKRPQSNGSRASRKQTSSHHGRRRSPPGSDSYRRKRP